MSLKLKDPTAGLRLARLLATAICVVLLLPTVERLDVGEYSGGAISGKLISVGFLAIVTLFASAALAFYRRKASLALGVIGAVLVPAPVIYFAYPRVFDFLGGVSSVQLESGPLAPDGFWPILLSALVVVAVALAEIAIARQPAKRSPASA